MILDSQHRPPDRGGMEVDIQRCLFVCIMQNINFQGSAVVKIKTDSKKSSLPY